MEQFAKLSTGNRRRGSSPRLSAQRKKTCTERTGLFLTIHFWVSNGLYVIILLNDKMFSTFGS